MIIPMWFASYLPVVRGLLGWKSAFSASVGRERQGRTRVLSSSSWIIEDPLRGPGNGVAI
jgi:hypothetical protein